MDGSLAPIALFLLWTPAEAGSQETWRDTPHLDSILVKRAMPLPHHHIHASLAAAVSWECETLLWPALLRVFVDSQRHVLCPVDVPEVMKSSRGLTD